MSAIFPPRADDTAWTGPLFDTLAAGLDVAEPVRVLVPPDGDWRWRETCSICLRMRTECPTWEAHAVQRRRAYAVQTGFPYELSRCGRCGEPVGEGVVQRDGVRYCDDDHAALLVVSVVVGDDGDVWPRSDAGSPLSDVGSALCGKAATR